MGCVIIELVYNLPIFQGKSAKDQFKEIMKILGTPNEDDIKSMGGKQINVDKLPKYKKIGWKDVLKGKTNDELFIDLVEKLMLYNPSKRLGPYEAMCHPYFDDIKKKEVILPDNKSLPEHLFKFKQCEILFDKESIYQILEQIEK